MMKFMCLKQQFKIIGVQILTFIKIKPLYIKDEI